MYLNNEELKKYGVTRVGDRRYIIPCERCHRTVTRTQFSLKRSYVCNYCKKAEKAMLLAVADVFNIETKTDRRFNAAVEKVLKGKRYEKYERAIETVEPYKEHFDSIPEAMVAIELVKQGFKVIPQQKIGRFTTDFVLPDYKIVLEIDGELYHQDSKEAYRDLYIRSALGMEWKVAHVTTDYVEKDVTKIGTYIKKLAKLNTLQD